MDSDEIESMSSTLVGFMTDQKLASVMGKKSMDYALSNLTIGGACSKLEDLLEELVSTSGSVSRRARMCL